MCSCSSKGREILEKQAERKVAEEDGGSRGGGRDSEGRDSRHVHCYNYNELASSLSLC